MQKLNTPVKEGFFSLAGAWNALAASARQNDMTAFQAASSSLDIWPEVVIRGLAYMTYRLATTPADEDCPGQTKSALFATAEVLALVAAMLEHRNEADIKEKMAAMTPRRFAEKGAA